MWLLSRVLPLLVGDRVPEDDERWQNFLVSMEIVDRLFCPKLTEDDVTYIKCIINEHHCDLIHLSLPSTQCHPQDALYGTHATSNQPVSARLYGKQIMCYPFIHVCF